MGRVFFLLMAATAFAWAQADSTATPAGASNAPEVLKQSIEVTAQQSALETFSKTTGSLHETPRALTMVSSQQARERNYRNVPDMLAFIPGISPNSYRNGSYHFYARGFRMSPEDTRVDGMMGTNLGGGGFGASLFGVEQTMVLRGPAGILYGSNASPGGLINLVSKKPQPTRSTRLDLRGGSYAGNGVTLSQRPSGSFDFDSTGAVTRNERLLYRSLFTYEDQNYFTRNTLDKNRYVNSSVTYRIDRLGLYTITPMFQYGWSGRPAGGGIVASPTTSLSANDGISGPIYTHNLSPVDVNLSAGRQLTQSSNAGFDFRAVPTMKWTTNLSYRWLRNDRGTNQFTPQVTSAAQFAQLQNLGLVSRLQAKSESRNRYHNVDFNTAYEFTGQSWKNSVQVGAYTRVVGTRATALQGTAPTAQSPINIYTGLATIPLIDAYPSIVFNPLQLTTNWNGYLQDRVSLFNGKLVGVMGLGYGQSHPGGARVRKSNLLPNFSLMYNFTPLLAVYTSYATSFNPTDPTIQDAAGRQGTFDPTTGKNYELGAKFDLPNRRASATLSFFRNNISNGLVQSGINDVNANGIRYYISAGTRRGRGSELSTDFRVRSNLTITAAASYTDATYTGQGPASAASTLAIPGSKAEKTPKWAWNTRANYQRSEGRLAGFGGSVALLWQGQRLGSNGARTFAAPDPLMLPAYTRVDASASYRINRHWDTAFNMENLTDRKIFVNATVGSAIEIAPPRTATLRLSYSF